jgi:lipopolysaccharide biosynthesis protein
MDLDHYDRLVLANDSVYGPLFPSRKCGRRSRRDMYGSIESSTIHRNLSRFFSPGTSLTNTAIYDGLLEPVPIHRKQSALDP